MTGILIFNNDRPDIAQETGNLYGGLHCGNCFRCLINGEWLDVRLEYDTDWVLVHNEKYIPVCYGAKIQM